MSIRDIGNALDTITAATNLSADHRKLLENIRTAVLQVALESEAAQAKLSGQQDLHGVLADKDAENVRLRAEINRLRHNLDRAGKLSGSHADEIRSLQTQMHQSAELQKAQERHAILAAASQAPERRELAQLQAELDAKSAITTRLEAELSAQSSASAARLAELQNSFTAKIRDMRSLHQQQLLAAEKSATSSGSSVQAELVAARQQQRQLEEHVETLKAEMEAQHTSISNLSTELQQCKAQTQQDQERITQLSSELRAASFAAKQLQQKNKELEQRLKEAASNSAPGAGASPATPGMDLSMLQMMESQLGNLSAIIKAREAEVADLRAAVQAGCDERRELVQQLDKLTQLCGSSGIKTDVPGPGPTSPTHAGGSGSHSGMPGSPGSMKGTSMSPSKPYRTGLTSKPKFR